MKRARAESGRESSESDIAKKRRVEVKSYQKWQKELDKDYQTLSWLECTTTTSKDLVDELKCKVCAKFMDKLVGMRNFNDKWICVAKSLRISNIKDHAKSDQHARAMMYARKEFSRATCTSATDLSDAPILKSLLTLSDEQKVQLSNKFDIAYFVAIEDLAFRKYPKICELEARHGVNIGTAYVNEIAGKTFCHYVAESRRQELIKTISKTSFFSILLDGSTDKGNIDDEIFFY